MLVIDSDTRISITSDCQKGESYLTRKRERAGVLLNLSETPRTWFHWNGKDENIREAPPEVFDAWISQYALISNVDRDVWEIFHRWDIINLCIRSSVLRLQKSEGKASIVEADSEAFPSDENSGESAPQAPEQETA